MKERTKKEKSRRISPSALIFSLLFYEYDEYWGLYMISIANFQIRNLNSESEVGK